MTPDELLAFCCALPPTVTRIKFHDRGIGPVEIEQLPPAPATEPAPAPAVRAPLTAAEIQAAYEARAAAEKPSDVDSLSRLPPPFPSDD